MTIEIAGAVLWIVHLINGHNSLKSDPN